MESIQRGACVNNPAGLLIAKQGPTSYNMSKSGTVRQSPSAIKAPSAAKEAGYTFQDCKKSARDVKKT